MARPIERLFTRISAFTPFFMRPPGLSNSIKFVSSDFNAFSGTVLLAKVPSGKPSVISSSFKLKIAYPSLLLDPVTALAMPTAIEFI